MHARQHLAVRVIGLGRWPARTEFLAPNGKGALKFTSLQPGDGVAHQGRIKALVTELLPDARHAQLGRSPVQHRFDNPPGINEALGLKLVQRQRERAGLGLESLQLAFKLAARMLTRTQQPQCAALE